MPDARRKRGSRAATCRRLAIVGLGAFVLLDVGLVALAVTRVPAGDGGDARASTPMLSLAPSQTPAATPTATGIAPATEAVPVTRLLSAVDASTAWRADVGSCTTNGSTPPAAAVPTLERTTSAGTTWEASSVTTSGGMTGFDRLQATDATTAFAIGPSGSTCAPEFVQTFSEGAAYRTYPERLAESWYVSQSSRGTVHSPSGDHVAPCQVVVDLAVVSDNEAGVLCSNRTFFRTTDSAATWDTGTLIEGAVAVTADVATYLVASVDVGDCLGTTIAVPAETPGAVATRVGCAPATSQTPGAIALSAGDDALWLWADNTVIISKNGGVTW